MSYRLVLFFFFFSHHSNAVQYTCTNEFCNHYVEKHECPPTGNACQIQNSTNNGEIFPAGVPCGCCNVCLQNLQEGDYCTLGSPDITPPMLACGPGLYCQVANALSGENTCQKMTHTACFKSKITHEANNGAGAFVFPPKCDGDGNYAPVKCSVNQTCFCVNDQGERIFGEAIYSMTTYLAGMKCECSRMYDKFERLMSFKYPPLMARCLEDGSFDTLQCLGENCVCVEPESGSPKEEAKEVLNSDFSKFACYNRSFHLPSKYLHNCEEILVDLLHEISSANRDQYNLLDFKIPNCQPDGWFAAVQNTATRHRICVDKYNKQIEMFEALIDSEEAEQINCKCARTRHLMKKYYSEDLPQCQTNGNFEKKQCRNNKQPDGERLCYCVDENGFQISKEVSESTKIIC